eukprot:SAG31_NODE_6686_length_1924_cov_6.421157_1_plen_259_part_10
MLNGNYTITIPKSWSKYPPGYRYVKIMNGSEPIIFSQDSYNSRLYPEHIRIDVQPAQCPAGKFDKTIGTVACFDDGYDKNEVSELHELWNGDQSESFDPCEDCSPIQRCVSCSGRDGIPQVLPGWSVGPLPQSYAIISSENNYRLIFRCPGGKTACPGAKLYNRRGMHRTHGFAHRCADNHNGTLCSQCEHGFFSVSLNSSCDTECSDIKSNTIPSELILLAIYATAVLGVLLVSRMASSNLLAAMRDEEMRNVSRGAA